MSDEVYMPEENCKVDMSAQRCCSMNGCDHADDAESTGCCRSLMYGNVGHAWVGEDESKRICRFMQDCWLTLSTFTLYSSCPWGRLTQLNRTTQSRRVDDVHDYAGGHHDEGRTTKS